MRLPVVAHKGRYLTPTNKFLLAVPDMTTVMRTVKRKNKKVKIAVEVFITLYVVVDMDDMNSQRAAVWGGKVDKTTSTGIVGDVLWDSVTQQYYVKTGSGCSKLQEWLS